MGQYLTFGITTKVKVAKVSFRTGKPIGVSLDQLIERMGTHLRFTPDIFDFADSEEVWVWTLKPSVLGEPLVDFLQQFYSDLAAVGPKFAEETLSSLRGASAADQLALAKDQELECFQIDKYSEPDYLHFDEIAFRPSVCVSYEAVGLHFEGKISVESIHQSLAFMTRVLRQHYSRFPVAQALRLCITG
jgi:hypothetical protein